MAIEKLRDIERMRHSARGPWLISWPGKMCQSADEKLPEGAAGAVFLFHLLEFAQRPVGSDTSSDPRYASPRMRTGATDEESGERRLGTTEARCRTRLYRYRKRLYR